MTPAETRMRPHLATLIDDFRRHGDQMAMVTHIGNRRLPCTWGQLAEQSARFAAELGRRGIIAGDRVILYGANSAEWVAAFFGCILRGVVSVPLDAAGGSAFATRVIKETMPRLIVGDQTLLHALAGDLERLPFARFAFLPAPDFTAAAGLDRASTLQIIFTSGTTSEPKGVVHTHGNVLASLDPIEREIAKYLRYERLVHPLRFLHTLPLSHVFGQFMGLWVPPLLAAEVHFEERLEASRLVKIIKRERISVLAAVPRVLDLLRSFLLAQQPDLSTRLQAAGGASAWKRWWIFRRQHRLLGLKFWAFVCGGATVLPELESFWNGLGFVLIQGYGMTETTALVTLNHPFKVARGSIGKPLAGREMRIAPDGEIEVRGGSIAESVWRDGAIEQRAAAGEWLRTGDLASWDARGELVFSGRKGDVIVTQAGLNVHPQDLEAALAAFAGVRTAIVVAVETQGSALLTAVFPRQHFATIEAAQSAVEKANAHLAPHQQMRSALLWPDPDFPRTSTGKVQRRKVANWAAHALAGSSGGERTEAADSLLNLIGRVPGAQVPNGGLPGNDLRLREDLHLDSLGLVELQSLLTIRFGREIEDSEMQAVRTVEELRSLLSPPGDVTGLVSDLTVQGRPAEQTFSPKWQGAELLQARYPRWPWRWPIRLARTVFQAAVMRPLVRLLARPRIEQPIIGREHGPMLIVANHVSAFDVALLLYALPKDLRRDAAVAMAADLLTAWRGGHATQHGWVAPLTPMAYWLVTALFNVFPLPRGTGFRQSFAHAGEALDRGCHVIVFPEGRRSKTGVMGNFQGGIGLLAQQSRVPVLPAYLAGLGIPEIPLRRRTIGVRFGSPLTMSEGEDPKAFTERLQAAVLALANGQPSSFAASLAK